MPCVNNVTRTKKSLATAESVLKQEKAFLKYKTIQFTLGKEQSALAQKLPRFAHCMDSIITGDWEKKQNPIYTESA